MIFIKIENIDILSLISGFDDEVVIEKIIEEDVKGLEIDCLEQVSEEEAIDPCPVLVDIGGAVKTPGVYCFEKEASVIDAVKKAKGFTKDAGLEYISMKINLATKMVDNSKIYIPFEKDYDCKLLTFSLPKEIVEITTPETEPEEPEEVSTECISINDATQQELETLEGIGPSTATKIIEGRPYEVLEDLLNVSGIGETTFNNIEDSICL